MRETEAIVRDILTLKLGDKNTAATEMNRLSQMAKEVELCLSGGMLSTKESFIQALQKNMCGEAINKTTLAMLNAVYKTLQSPKSISMLGKLLFNDTVLQDDYILILLYRLLELNGLTIRATPNGYNALRTGITTNRLIDFTEPIRAEVSMEFSAADLLNALFIMNDEPDGDIFSVKDCAALHEYRRIVDDVMGMSKICIENIPDYTSYPNMALIMGLRAISKTGKTIEFQKDAFERLAMLILTRQPVDMT